jgi:hypothetical protein
MSCDLQNLWKTECRLSYPTTYGSACQASLRKVSNTAAARPLRNRAVKIAGAGGGGSRADHSCPSPVAEKPRSECCWRVRFDYHSNRGSGNGDWLPNICANGHRLIPPNVLVGLVAVRLLAGSLGASHGYLPRVRSGLVQAAPSKRLPRQNQTGRVCRRGDCRPCTGSARRCGRKCKPCIG